MTYLISPLYISSRLMAAVRIGDVQVQVEEGDHQNSQGKPSWHYMIEQDGEHEDRVLAEGDDLYGYGDENEMMASLLNFLGACAESVEHARRRGQDLDDTENGTLFPVACAEWAEQNSDEIAIIGCELEEEMERRRKEERERERERETGR